MGNVLEKIRKIGDGENLEGKHVIIHKKRYLCEEALGRGGFGSVYRARTAKGQKVAIKITEISSVDDPGYYVNSYLNEVKHLNRLRRRTPSIVRIYDFDFDPATGRAYLVMELADQSLDSLIKSVHETHKKNSATGFMPAGVRKVIWQSVVAVVHSLHQNHTVHLDLKPANFLVFGKTVKIADLGISKHGFKPAIGGLGSYPFSAPEVMRDTPGARRNYGPHADLWSLGVILYYLTYGTLPDYVPGASRPPPSTQPTRDYSLQDLLNRLLVLDPRRRITMAQVLSHPYTVGRSEDASIYKHFLRK